MNRQTDRQTHRQARRYTNRKTERRAYKGARRQANRQTDTLKGKSTHTIKKLSKNKMKSSRDHHRKAEESPKRMRTTLGKRSTTPKIHCSCQLFLASELYFYVLLFITFFCAFLFNCKCRALRTNVLLAFACSLAGRSPGNRRSILNAPSKGFLFSLGFFCHSAACIVSRLSIIRH